MAATHFITTIAVPEHRGEAPAGAQAHGVFDAYDRLVSAISEGGHTIEHVVALGTRRLAIITRGDQPLPSEGFTW